MFRCVSNRIGVCWFCLCRCIIRLCCFGLLFIICMFVVGKLVFRKCCVSVLVSMVVLLCLEVVLVLIICISKLCVNVCLVGGIVLLVNVFSGSRVSVVKKVMDECFMDFLVLGLVFGLC